MQQTEKYIEQFNSLNNGDHWLDVSFMPVLKNITAEQAISRSLNNANSIWTIVNHVIFWRKNLTMKLNGEDTKGDKDFEPIVDNSVECWKNTLNELTESLNNLTKALSVYNDNKLSDTYKGIATYDQLIIGTLQHDAYHLGQIVILSKNL